MSKHKDKLKRRDPSTEYAVYIFHRPSPKNDNEHPNWEKRHTTFSLRVATRKAENLISTQAYERVEIKKKFFDRRTARNVHKTLKIYKENKNRPVGMLAFLKGIIRQSRSDRH